MEGTIYFNQQQEPVLLPKGVKPIPRECAYAIMRDGQKAMMVRDHHNPQWWMFPGGGVKPDESTEAGLEREVLEETGIEIVFKNITIESQHSHFHASDVNTFYDATLNFYIIRQYKQTDQSFDRNEILEASWKTIDDLSDKEVHPLHVQAVHIARNLSASGRRKLRYL